MIWIHSMIPNLPGYQADANPEVDRLVRRMATDAGADWDLLPKHPGFERDQWRERASNLLNDTRAVLETPGFERLFTAE